MSAETVLTPGILYVICCYDAEDGSLLALDVEGSSSLTFLKLATEMVHWFFLERELLVFA